MDRFVARTEELLVEELDGGLVLYDQRSHQAHWLDAQATAVWRACDEPREDAEIAHRAGLDAEGCEEVLSHLVNLDLVQSESGYSRRVVLRTAAKVGLSGAVAAPIISAVVPVAAAHASTGGAGNGGSPPPQTPYRFDVHSGDGGDPGTVDGNTCDVTYGGCPITVTDQNTGTTGPAYNVGHPYWTDPIPGSNWISFESNGDSDWSLGDDTYSYQVTIQVPATATGASISGSWMSDNDSTVLVNGTQVASGGDNFGGPPDTFGPVPLSPGSNVLTFQVHNGGGPTGLDFLATVSYNA